MPLPFTVSKIICPYMKLQILNNQISHEINWLPYVLIEIFYSGISKEPRDKVHWKSIPIFVIGLFKVLASYHGSI